LAHLRNGEFGRYTTLKEITTIDNTNKKKISKQPKTRIIRISEPLYQKFVNFSERYYNVESYSTILENLINEFESRNQNKSWRDIERLIES
jgi:hypothetical protein